MAVQPIDLRQTAVGLVFLAAIGVVLYLMVAALMQGATQIGSQLLGWAFTPPPGSALSLSAHFEPVDPASEPREALKVIGSAQQSGKAIKSGTVQLLVRKLNSGFRQSHQIDIGARTLPENEGQREGSGEATNPEQNVLSADETRRTTPAGRFEVFDLPSWRTLRRGDPIHIEATMWSEELKDSGIVSAETYLGIRTPGVPQETRKLIIVSFCVALLVATAVFLWTFTGPSIPRKRCWAVVLSYVGILFFLVVPFGALQMFPYIFPRMNESMKDAAVGVLVAEIQLEDQTTLPAQWVLNIGGKPKTQIQAGTPPPSAERTADEETRSSVVTSVSGPDQGLQPNDSQPTSNSGDTTTTESGNLVIEGGLVVPLYFIFLALIGGVVNMTREVPRIQTAGAQLGTSHVLTRLEKLYGRLFSRSGQDQHAANRDASGNDSESIAAIDRSARRWRTRLVEQYMFVISAPFVAVAAYYLNVVARPHEAACNGTRRFLCRSHLRHDPGEDTRRSQDFAEHTDPPRPH